jgi:hypothetical protein
MLLSKKVWHFLLSARPEAVKNCGALVQINTRDAYTYNSKIEPWQAGHYPFPSFVIINK